MRHVHRSDVEFLDAFMDRSVTARVAGQRGRRCSHAPTRSAPAGSTRWSRRRGSPLRYRGDETVRALCATVVPLAGLLAETGLTMREDEAGALRTLAGSDPQQLEQMLLSADHFCDLHASDLTVEIRRSLARPARDVRRALLDPGDPRQRRSPRRRRSRRGSSSGPGLNELKTVIAQHFLPRARTLQSRGALVALRTLAHDMRASDPDRSPIPSTAKPNASRPARSSSPGSAPRTSCRRARPSCATASATSSTACCSRARPRRPSASTAPAVRRAEAGRPRRHRTVAGARRGPVRGPGAPGGVRDRRPHQRGDLRRRRLTQLPLDMQPGSCLL